MKDNTFTELSEMYHPVLTEISEHVDGDVGLDSPRFMWDRLGDSVARSVGSAINMILHSALLDHRLTTEGGPDGGERS